MADDPSRQYWLETYKSLITISVEGFKFLALANGGAAVALLAYLGSATAKGTANMVCPMVAFALGITLCGGSMMFAYWTQLTLLNELSAGGNPRAPHQGPLWVAMALFTLSLAAFGAGSVMAAVRLQGG